MEEEAIDLFALESVDVRLSYAGLGVTTPIVFHLRPYMTDEDEAVRQSQFTLTDEERKARAHRHNVELLARLSVKEPDGVRGMDADKESGKPLAQRITAFFIDEHPMRRKVVAEALTRYFQITQPSEFFRGV